MVAHRHLPVRFLSDAIHETDALTVFHSRRICSVPNITAAFYISIEYEEHGSSWSLFSLGRVAFLFLHLTHTHTVIFMLHPPLFKLDPPVVLIHLIQGNSR